MVQILSKEQSSANKTTAVQHQKAAEHHDLAATHHKEAAIKLEVGDHEAAAHHSVLAQAHACHAKDEAVGACKTYAASHGAKKP